MTKQEQMAADIGYDSSTTVWVLRGSSLQNWRILVRDIMVKSK